MKQAEIKTFYQTKFKKHGVAPQSLLWARKGAAHQRFRQIWAEVDFSGMRILDVGCGFGELAKFIGRKAEGFTYTGIDIVPEFVEEAQKQFPQHTFFVGDYLTEPIPGKYDIVVASGILNSNVENNMEYRVDAINKLYALSRKVTVFNMLGSHPQPENREESNIWYADSIEIIKHCFTLTRRVLIRHHYHPKDFTVFLYHTKK